MRRLGLLSALVTFLALLFAPRLARAEERVAKYEIDVTPQESGVAHYRVLVAYTSARFKTSGFKYVGDNSISHFSAVDDKGTKLPATSRRDGSGEVKIEVDLRRSEQDDKTMVLSFDQELDRTSGWIGSSAEIPWAHKFRIPVDAMTVRVHGPLAEAGDGFTCRGAGARRVCSRTASSPFEVDFGMAGSFPLVPWLVLGGALAMTAVFVASVVARRRRDLITTRGVVPPVAEVAYPPGDYRVAPVIPKGGTVEPKLSEEDAKAFKQRVRNAAIACAIPTALAALAAPGWMAPQVFSALAVAIGCATFAFLVFREKPGKTLFVLPSGTALFFVLGSAIGGVIVAFVLGIVAAGGLLFIHLLAQIEWGKFGGTGGGTSWSSGGSSWSSSSSSSCGGGGGSSCGGGGGSSCGGGGGGGGCGG